MTIANAFKSFIKSLTGHEPVGNNIAEIINDGSKKVVNLSKLNTSAIKYENAMNKSFVLKSSTNGSTKQFRISVDDTGAITATVIV